jgi:hypothetical protein
MDGWIFLDNERAPYGEVSRTYARTVANGAIVRYETYATTGGVATVSMVFVPGAVIEKTPSGDYRLA